MNVVHLLLAILGSSLLLNHGAKATEPPPANTHVTLRASAASQKDEALIERSKYVVLLAIALLATRQTKERCWRAAGRW